MRAVVWKSLSSIGMRGAPTRHRPSGNCVRAAASVANTSSACGPDSGDINAAINNAEPRRHLSEEPETEAHERLVAALVRRMHRRLVVRHERAKPHFLRVCVCLVHRKALPPRHSRYRQEQSLVMTRCASLLFEPGRTVSLQQRKTS